VQAGAGPALTVRLDTYVKTVKSILLVISFGVEPPFWRYIARPCRDPERSTVVVGEVAVSFGPVASC